MNLVLTLYSPMSAATAAALSALTLAASEDVRAANAESQKQFLSGEPAPPPSHEPPQASQDEPKAIRKPREAKLPDNPKTIDAEAKQTDDLTVEAARERMKKFAGDGHMDQVSAALEAYGVKKVSDVPTSTVVQNATFAGFVAKIEELVKAKG